MRKIITKVGLIILIITNIFIIEGCNKSTKDNEQKFIFKKIDSRKDYTDLIRDFDSKAKDVVNKYVNFTYKLDVDILNGDNVSIKFFDKEKPTYSFLGIYFKHENNNVNINMNFSHLAKGTQQNMAISEQKQNLFYDLIKNCFNDTTDKEEIQKKLDNVKEKEKDDKNVSYKISANNGSMVVFGYEQGILTSLSYNFNGQIPTKSEELINDTISKDKEEHFDNYHNGNLKTIAELAGGSDSDIEVKLNEELSKYEVEKRLYSFNNQRNFSYNVKFIKMKKDNKDIVENLSDFNILIKKDRRFVYSQSTLYQSIKILYNDEINKIIDESIRKINNGEVEKVVGSDSTYRTEAYNEDLNMTVNVELSKDDIEDSYTVSVINGCFVK